MPPLSCKKVTETNRQNPLFRKAGSNAIFIVTFYFPGMVHIRFERETGLEPATTTLATWGSTT